MLVAGGATSNITSTASCQVYDPVAGTWSATGSLITARDSHAAALLPDGRVMVFGGSSNNTPPALTSAEIWDPATGVWSQATPISGGGGSSTRRPCA